MEDTLEPGQRLLAIDLGAILLEVNAGEFGDFSNEKYATPKMELFKKLSQIIENTTNGKYD